MGLSPEEEKRLAELENKDTQKSNLSLEEEQRLKQLEDLAAKEFEQKSAGVYAPQNVLAEIGGYQIPTPKSAMVRFLSKNFGTDTPETLQWVQNLSPEGLKAVREPKTNRIFYQTPEGINYPMDPSHVEIQDITDSAYNLLSGTAQSMGAAAGGMAGMTAGAPLGPYGAYTGATLGGATLGGATAGGMEGIRQSIGQMLGMNPKTDWNKISEETKLGAFIPTLFGRGVSKQEALRTVQNTLSGASRDQLEKEATRIYENQKGLLGKAWDTTSGAVGKTMSSYFGGYPKVVLKNMYEMLPDFAKAEKDPAIFRGEIEANKADFTNAMRSTQKELSDEYGTVLNKLDEAGVSVKTNNVLSPLENLKKQIVSSEFQPEYKKEIVDEISKIENKYIYEKVLVPPKLTPQEQALVNSGVDISKMKIPQPTEKYVLRPEIKASEAKDLSESLTDLGYKYGLDFGNIDTSKGIAEGTTSKAKDISRALVEASKNAREGISVETKNIDPVLSEEFKRINGKYAEFKDLQDEFFKSTKDNNAYINFLKRDNLLAKEQKQRMSQVIGKDVEDIAGRIAAYDIFTNPKKQIPNFGQSTTGRALNASRVGGMVAGAIPAALLSPSPKNFAASAAAYGLGSVMAPYFVSPSGIRNLMEGNNFFRNIVPEYAPRATPYLMMKNFEKDKGE